MKILVKSLLLLIFPISLIAQPSDPFQWMANLSPRKVAPGGEIPLEISFVIPANHLLYKDKMDLKMIDPRNSELFELEPLELPKAETKKDPFTEEEKEIYHGSTLIKSVIRAKKSAAEGEYSLKLELSYQGCSEKLCFRQVHRELLIPVTISSVPDSGATLQDKSQAPFQKKNFWWLVLLAFLGGLGSDLTPCVLPIIPITLAFIGVRKQESSTAKNFILSLFLVLSMSITYAVMGMAAALLGKSLGFLFQNPYFLLGGVAMFVLFSLSLFGLFEIQIPLRLRNAMAKLGGGGVIGSILAGATVGFLAAPCVGPLIGSLLLYVAKERDLTKGFILLFTYGLGMGSLFLVIGTYYHRFAAKVHGGPYMVWIKRVFAVLLLIPAFYYGSIAYQHFKRPESMNTEAGSPTFWITDPDAAFAKAAQESKPLFVDFFATWCVPCLQMDKGTFTNMELRNFLSTNFVPLKVECTEETPTCKKMVDRYSVVGWPTFLILNSQGEVVESLVGRTVTAPELQGILEKNLKHLSSNPNP